MLLELCKLPREQGSFAAVLSVAVERLFATLGSLPLMASDALLEWLVAHLVGFGYVATAVGLVAINVHSDSALTAMAMIAVPPCGLRVSSRYMPSQNSTHLRQQQQRPQNRHPTSRASVGGTADTHRVITLFVCSQVPVEVAELRARRRVAAHTPSARVAAASAGEVRHAVVPPHGHEEDTAGAAAGHAAANTAHQRLRCRCSKSEGAGQPATVRHPHHPGAVARRHGVGDGT